MSDPVSAPWAEEAVAEARELHLPPPTQEEGLAGGRPGQEHRSREEEVLARIERARQRKPRVKEERITLAHGSGGKATHTLVEAIFLEAFRNPLLEPLEDQAILTAGAQRLAFTTDSYVVSPLFFPGGNIGDLAVNGTVNDLAVSGARPLWLSAGFLLEEGFPVADLERIVRTIAEAAAAAGERSRAESRRARRERRGPPAPAPGPGLGPVPVRRTPAPGAGRHRRGGWRLVPADVDPPAPGRDGRRRPPPLR